MLRALWACSRLLGEVHGLTLPSSTMGHLSCDSFVHLLVFLPSNLLNTCLLHIYYVPKGLSFFCGVLSQARP